MKDEEGQAYDPQEFKLEVSPAGVVLVKQTQNIGDAPTTTSKDVT